MKKTTKFALVLLIGYAFIGSAFAEMIPNPALLNPLLKGSGPFDQGVVNVYKVDVLNAIEAFSEEEVLYGASVYINELGTCLAYWSAAYSVLDIAIQSGKPIPVEAVAAAQEAAMIIGFHLKYYTIGLELAMGKKKFDSTAFIEASDAMAEPLIKSIWAKLMNRETGRQTLNEYQTRCMPILQNVILINKVVSEELNNGVDPKDIVPENGYEAEPNQPKAGEFNL